MTTADLVKQEQAPSFRIIGFISGVLFGAVFVFSGLIKAIDPLGTTYKMQEYMQAMGLVDLPQLYYLVLAGSILMIAFEFTIGLSLISGIQLKFFSWCALAFMLVMTPLTLWLAVKDPITDCGCFGDCFVISNWATFGKNIVLLALITVVLYCNKYYRPYLSPLPSWLIVCSFIVFSVCISLYSLRHLPLIDCRPYKIGNNISEKMSIPEGAELDQWQTFFIYKSRQTGKEQEFALKDIPYIDTISWQVDTLTWEYIGQDSKQIKKGYEPPIHDFIIESSDDGDITEEILADENFVFIFVMYDLSKTHESNMQEINELYNVLKEKNIRVFALTASLSDDIEQFSIDNGTEFPYYSCDGTALKTMIRANPGVVVLKKGNVIDKWNAADTKKEFEEFRKKNKL
jgi:uncharacterized membrane protein YphA (DoxX/SURF4 family)